MSHHSLAKLWSELEKRTDQATALRDAIGRYAVETASCGEDCSSGELMQAFNRLINYVHVAFQLQRVYLQPEIPSSHLVQFLIEPSLVVDILVFLLKVKDDTIRSHQTSSSIEREVLHSMGSVLLAGVRLLNLQKAKVSFTVDQEWDIKAGLLKSKLANWPLQDRVHRFLVKEVCLRFLELLSTATEVRHCERPEHRTGTVQPPELPDYHNEKLVSLFV